MSRQHLVQDNAERIQVAAAVHDLGRALKRLQMLRRHVGEGAAHLGRGNGGATQLGVFRHAEVQQHRLPFVRQQHVRRLEIPVQDAALVRVGQAVGQA